MGRGQGGGRGLLDVEVGGSPGETGRLADRAVRRRPQDPLARDGHARGHRATVSGQLTHSSLSRVKPT